MRGGGSDEAKIEVATLEFADSPHTTNDEADDEEEKPFGEKGVDGEHEEDTHVVCGKVAQVEVDSILSLAEVGRLRQSLEVEELGNWLETREASAEALGTHSIEATEIQTRRQYVEWDVQARGHDVLVKVCLAANSDRQEGGKTGPLSFRC